ncbi:hypothetical protein MAR_020500 [Mya arenaria]|uniref:Uncharacterized protein n=1 Tax=Mya arenaria TaxID=6604 RepID=A0ABY7E960_MYAAR|nr:hypothetical protein MAR_020500 [Mya arenaria]
MAGVQIKLKNVSESINKGFGCFNNHNTIDSFLDYKNVSVFAEECPEIKNLSNLPEVFACFINKDCSTIRCCLEVGLLKRKVEMMVKIDFCNFRIEAEIDQLKVSKAFIDYTFGKRCVN